MKSTIYIFLWALLTLAVASCNKFEMEYYAQSAAINFMGIDNRGFPTDDPTTLKSEFNFGTTLPIPDSTNIDTLKITVRLQGKLSAEPLKISLSTMQDGDKPLATVKPLNPYFFKDSAYQIELKVPIHRPEERHKIYKAKLIFDYANSDLKRGVEELQVYDITIKDELTREMIGISAEDWDWDFEYLIGPYSENKARFMVMVFGTVNLYSIMPYGPNAARINMLKTALEHYNTVVSPGNPLKDENGNLITFNPA